MVIVMPQCEATAHSTGERCERNAIKGSNVCQVHGGAAPQVKAKAKERLAEAAGGAAATLVELKNKLETIINDKTLDPKELKQLASEARKQATEILDRAGEEGAPKVSRQELTGEDGDSIEVEGFVEKLHDVTEDDN